MNKKITNRKLSSYGIYFLILLFSYFLFLSTPVLATDVENPPSEEIAGIMHSVTADCWNDGNCQLEDMMQVFVNIADFILGIVGSLALLLFVVGGFYFLFAQGESSKITKGKDYLKGAIVGLLIVFVAYIGVQGLETALKTGSLPGTAGYSVCSVNNDGAACAEFSSCYNGRCVYTCEAQHALYASCIDGDQLVGAESDELVTCVNGENICPGENDQCCYNNTVETNINDGGDEIDWGDPENVPTLD
ncbi:MAG: pilin [Candidatus Uhrbacteria bacterium]